MKGEPEPQKEKKESWIVDIENVTRKTFVSSTQGHNKGGKLWPTLAAEETKMIP